MNAVPILCHTITVTVRASRWNRGVTRPVKLSCRAPEHDACVFSQNFLSTKLFSHEKYQVSVRQKDEQGEKNKGKKANKWGGTSSSASQPTRQDNVSLSTLESEVFRNSTVFLQDSRDKARSWSKPYVKVKRLFSARLLSQVTPYCRPGKEDHRALWEESVSNPDLIAFTRSH